MEPRQDTTALVLAGGRGSRLGHINKGLQEFDGLPLVDHVIARLAPQVATLMISANQNLDIYRQRGFAVHADQFASFAGPLAGLHSGLSHCQTPWLLSAPCDSPYLPTDLVARLHQAQQRSGADVVVPCAGEGAGRRVHAAFCLVGVHLQSDLAQFLAAGGRAAQDWYRTLACVHVQFDDEQAFYNINTSQDLHGTQPADRKENQFHD